MMAALRTDTDSQDGSLVTEAGHAQEERVKLYIKLCSFSNRLPRKTPLK